MINTIVVDKSDNVVVAIELIEKETSINYTDSNEKKISLIAKNEIPIYHKVANKNILKGENIIKYGEHIGQASNDIEAGEHVHEHNVESVREDLMKTY